MNQEELQELVQQAEGAGGGVVLSVSGRPHAVILTVDKYNELLAAGTSAPVVQSAMTKAEAQHGEDLAEVSSGSVKTVLVTGGAGYIGAHVANQLIAAGYRVVVIDNLSTGKREHVPQAAVFVEGDAGDIDLMEQTLTGYQVDAVMHFAASLEAEESVKKPMPYLENNLGVTSRLVQAMNRADVKHLVFSSTAAVYGNAEVSPVSESANLVPTNPYGASKLLCEKVLRYTADNAGFHVVAFRYFNAAGGEPSLNIRSTHQSHLIPIVLQAAVGERPHVTVHGTDYQTHDGTCVRDYVHVVDIARAHVLALGRFVVSGPARTGKQFEVYNIGTGRGSSVHEVIAEASEVTGRMVPMEVGPRRAGDPVQLVADGRAAKEHLGFVPERSSLQSILTDAWAMYQAARLETK